MAEGDGRRLAGRNAGAAEAVSTFAVLSFSAGKLSTRTRRIAVPPCAEMNQALAIDGRLRFDAAFSSRLLLCRNAKLSVQARPNAFIFRLSAGGIDFGISVRRLLLTRFWSNAPIVYRGCNGG